MNFFKKLLSRKIIKKFYATPSLAPSPLERNELLSLLNNSNPDDNFTSLRRQARNLYSSSPLISGYFQTLEAEIYGDNGIMLDLHTQDSKLNKTIEDRFYLWRENLPHSSLDFWDIESLALLYLKRDGEAFVYVNESDLGLSVSIIDPENVDESVDDGKSIIKGIELDSKNNPRAYFIKDSSDKTKRVEARHILHIFERFAINQYRGVSPLRSVIYPIYQRDKFKSAELKRARLQSEITGFFVPNEADISPYTSDESESKNIIQSAEVGKMSYINDNVKPFFTESHNATNIEFFIKQTDREIAKALGISYSTLTGDLNDVNYSSIRHGGIEQRRQFRGLQNFIVRNLHNKIFEKWLINELKLANISTKEYSLILNAYSFKPQGWEYIDPYKETNANKIALESGQKTLSEILKERGKELDSHIDELNKENEIYKLLNERKKRG